MIIMSEIPFISNLNAIYSWLVVTLLFLISSVKITKLKTLISLPFLIFGTLALFVSFMHIENLYTGIVLNIFALILFIKYHKSILNINKMITQAGNYYLKQSYSETSNLIEFTQDEYNRFKLAGYTPVVNEKIYYGEKLKFNDIEWDVIIGVVGDLVYKISLQFMGSDKKNISNIFKNNLNYLIKEMGKYNESKFLSNQYVWDKNEGNVIYNKKSLYGMYCINLYFTSNIIKNYI